MMLRYPLGFVSPDVFKQQQLETPEYPQQVQVLYQLWRPSLTVYQNHPNSEQGDLNRFHNSIQRQVEYQTFSSPNSLLTTV